MLKLPSPAMSTTATSGRATFAPIAAGNPHPIVPRPVELKNVQDVLRQRIMTPTFDADLPQL